MNLSKHKLIDLNDLAELAKSTYSEGEIISQQYLEWEYNSNPAGKAIIYKANEMSIAVSQYALIPREIVFEKKIVNGSLSLNTITHPVFRGKGLFQKLAELTYDECLVSGIDFTIGFPNANSVKIFISKLKFTEIGRLTLLLNIVNPFRAIVNYLRKRNSKGATEIELKFQSLKNGISLLDLSVDAEKYDKFLTSFKNRNYITTERSREFLQWRYVDIPLRKYYLFKYEVDGNIVSVIVLRAKNISGVRCGIVVDYFSDGSSNVPPNLFKELRKNKLDLIISTLPKNSVEYTNLRKLGFFKVPALFMFKKLHVIFRKHNRNISDSLADFKQWFITFGDYDIF